MTKIKVSLRVRPLSSREIEGGFPICVSVEDNSAFVTDIRVPERSKADSRPRYRQFPFDHGFWLDESASVGETQSEIFSRIGPPLEKSALEGYNACLLAYGQSGTGKTHTMLGSKSDPGIIPRLCHSIWEQLKVSPGTKSHGSSSKKLLRMEVSFMEIYREKVRDLLNPSEGHLKLREHPQLGPHAQNLRRVDVTKENSLLNLLWEGELRRAIGTTRSNRKSSRSHAIWTIYLTRQCSVNHSLITNQVHLVDLAGSEKAGFATAKNLLAEGADINRSLVALGNVISSLSEKAQYIPYRDSALTWLLRDSLGGNATTSIIITASPASCCHTQTLNSFRFAQRARLVDNQPRISLQSSSLLSDKSATASTLYSIMSAFEIKKDISRLSKIIKGCQNNGGLLRGMTPRASWTRLVSALEGWNHIEGEQLKLQRELALAEAETADLDRDRDRETSIKSDAMIQADLLQPSSSASASQSTSSNVSPSRVIGTEVFIPCSDSIKCLTWQQEKIRPAPKLQTPTDSIDSSQFLTPPPTPPTPSSRSSSRIHQMKYLLPVQFPVSHHLDHASRITEKIHGGVPKDIPPSEKPLQPKDVHSLHEFIGGNSPLKRNRVVTLANPLELESCAEPTLFTSSDNVQPVTCAGEIGNGSGIGDNGVFNFTDLDGKGEPAVLSEITSPKPKHVSVFEKLDGHEMLDAEIQGVGEPMNTLNVNHRLIRCAKKTRLKPKMRSSDEFIKTVDTHVPTFEDVSQDEIPQGEMSGNSVSVAQRRRKISLHHSPKESSQADPSTLLNSAASESTMESDIYQKPPPLENLNLDLKTFVKILPEESESSDPCMETEDSIPNSNLEEFVPRFASQIAEGYPDYLSYPDVVDESESISLPPRELSELVSEVTGPHSNTNSKFRMHFSQEINQMDKIGRQLKQLQKLSQQCQRFTVVQSFMEQICELKTSDHMLPDSKIDPHIEACSGWNVDVEYAKVNSEIESLGKLLQIGIVGGSGSSCGGAGAGGIDKAHPHPHHHQRRPSNSSMSSSTNPISSPSSSQESYDLPELQMEKFNSRARLETARRLNLREYHTQSSISTPDFPSHSQHHPNDGNGDLRQRFNTHANTHSASAAHDNYPYAFPIHADHHTYNNSGQSQNQNQNHAYHHPPSMMTPSFAFTSRIPPLPRKANSFMTPAPTPTPPTPEFHDHDQIHELNLDNYYHPSYQSQSGCSSERSPGWSLQPLGPSSNANNFCRCRHCVTGSRNDVSQGLGLPHLTNPTGIMNISGSASEESGSSAGFIHYPVNPVGVGVGVGRRSTSRSATSSTSVDSVPSYYSYGRGGSGDRGRSTCSASHSRGSMSFCSCPRDNCPSSSVPSSTTTPTSTTSGSEESTQIERRFMNMNPRSSFIPSRYSLAHNQFGDEVLPLPSLSRLSSRSTSTSRTSSPASTYA